MKSKFKTILLAGLFAVLSFSAITKAGPERCCYITCYCGTELGCQNAPCSCDFLFGYVVCPGNAYMSCATVCNK